MRAKKDALGALDVQAWRLLTNRLSQIWAHTRDAAGGHD